MATSFPSAVNPPGAASYSAGLMDFSELGNLYNDYQQTQLTEQQKKLNEAKLQQMQQQIELSKSFAGGLPTDPATGQVDYRKAAAILASKGDIGGAISLIQQQPPAMSPMFGGQGGQGGGAPQPQGQPGQAGAAGPQPMSIPAKPLPPVTAGSPRGDSGTGTITDIVTDRLPSQNQTTGATIMKIAQVMGVDPNSDLTAGQKTRAQGLLKKYAPDIAGPATSSFSDRFAGDQGGNLPPSANAVSPPPVPGQGEARTAGRSGAPVQGGGPVPAQAPPAGSPQSQPAVPQAQGPITPQVPLPKGFSDPEAAMTALRTEAVRMGQIPNGQQQSRALSEWADRIQESIKPISVGATTTLVDPRTGKTVFQGPGAAAYGASGETGQTLDADANQYRLTGKLPPNMGRGVQGQQQATAIRTRAAEQEIQNGGDPNDWPNRWQTFSTQASGKRTLETRAAGLKLAENEASRLIPRVREISEKIPRTQFPNLNSLILAAKKGTGDPDVIKLGVAVESLIPVYAKVLKPVGTVGAADMERAHDILDKAWSNGQINAALDQMQVELGSAKDALKETMEEYGGTPSKKSEGSSQGSSTGSGVWTTLPNGNRIREIKAGAE